MFYVLKMASIYDTIKEGFREHSTKHRIDFKHPQVKLSVDKFMDRSSNDIDLTDVWFNVVAKEPITEDQVRSAIALFHPPSKYDCGGYTHYTEIRSFEDPLSLDEIPSFYARMQEQLRDIMDKPPKTSVRDTILNGPVEVPKHKWGSVYCAFENFDREHPEFGNILNSVVLYRDGMALRIAKKSNWVHALSPTLAEIIENVDEGGSDSLALSMSRVVPFALEQDGVRSDKEAYKRMKNSPKPIIMADEVNTIAAYASEITGVDIRLLEYEIAPVF